MTHRRSRGLSTAFVAKTLPLPCVFTVVANAFCLVSSLSWLSRCLCLAFQLPRRAKPGQTPSGRPEDFPRSWEASTSGSQRGTAWFFFPLSWCSANPSACTPCNCQCESIGCPAVVCQGPTVEALKGKGVDIIKDRPWSIFIHGGEFHWNNNIDANYAFLSGNVAHAGVMCSHSPPFGGIAIVERGGQEVRWLNG